jgi:hypothetical protein
VSCCYPVGGMVATEGHTSHIRGLAREALARRIADFMSRARPSVDIVSGRASRSFPPPMRDALAADFAAAGVAVSLRELTAAPARPRADLVLLLCHVHKEEPAYLTALRDGGYPGLIAAWMWDNHHAKEANRRVARLADVTIAAHDVHAGYLAGHTTLFRSVNLCSTQWTPDEARTFWQTRGDGDRSPDLYGGFVGYKGTPRTGRLAELIASGRYPALRLLDGERGAGYFAQDEAARFREWTRHAVSLCLPYRNDLSNRFFDAWLTGQIPVVTPDVAELRSAWAAPYLDRHFVCAAGDDVQDLDAAHERALSLFVAGGAAAQEERHRLALTNHLFRNRIDEILTLFRQAARSGLDQALHPLAAAGLREPGSDRR